MRKPISRFIYVNLILAVVVVSAISFPVGHLAQSSQVGATYNPDPGNYLINGSSLRWLYSWHAETSNPVIYGDAPPYQGNVSAKIDAEILQVTENETQCRINRTQRYEYSTGKGLTSLPPESDTYNFTKDEIPGPIDWPGNPLNALSGGNTDAVNMTNPEGWLIQEVDTGTFCNPDGPVYPLLLYGYGNLLCYRKLPAEGSWAYADTKTRVSGGGITSIEGENVFLGPKADAFGQGYVTPQKLSVNLGQKDIPNVGILNTVTLSIELSASADYSMNRTKYPPPPQPEVHIDETATYSVTCVFEVTTGLLVYCKIEGMWKEECPLFDQYNEIYNWDFEWVLESWSQGVCISGDVLEAGLLSIPPDNASYVKALNLDTNATYLSRGKNNATLPWDQNGEYIVTCPPGVYQMWAWSPCYISNVKDRVEHALPGSLNEGENTTGINFRLAPSFAHLDFIIVDTQGIPIKGADINLTQIPMPLPSGFNITTQTNSSGQSWLELEATLAPCEANYTLTISKNSQTVNTTIRIAIPLCHNITDPGVNTMKVTSEILWESQSPPAPKRIRVKLAELPSYYNASILAHCNTEGKDVSVAIDEDGSPTGYNTPHTFSGLTGNHTFEVPTSDADGDPLMQWNNGQTSAQITVSSWGTYTAYYQASSSFTYSATATIIDGSAFVDQSSTTGVSVSLAGSSAQDGTNLTVTSTNYGSTQPSGTGVLQTNGVAFYDVRINASDSLGSDTIAVIYITNQDFSEQNSSMSFWNGSNWIPVASSFISPDTVAGDFTASDLTGTLIMIANRGTASSGLGWWSWIMIIAASVAILTLALVLVLRKRRRKTAAPPQSPPPPPPPA